MAEHIDPSVKELQNESHLLVREFNKLHQWIDKGQFKPWWLSEFDGLTSNLTKFISGELHCPLPATYESNQQTLIYFNQYTDIASGRKAGRLPFTNWTNRFYVNDGTSSGKLPDSEQKGRPQLAITQWWVGDKNGESESLGEKLRKIREAHMHDFIEQLSENVYKQGEISTESLKQRSLNVADFVGNIIISAVTIEHQIRYKDKWTGKQLYRPLVSMRIAEQIGGQHILSISGRDQRRDENLKIVNISETGRLQTVRDLPNIIYHAANLYLPSAR